MLRCALVAEFARWSAALAIPVPAGNGSQVSILRAVQAGMVQVLGGGREIESEERIDDGRKDLGVAH